MDSSVLFLLIAIVFAGILVFLAILLTQKRAYQFDIEEYQTRWLSIENQFTKEHPSSYNMSVVEADKLLDRALVEMGAVGKTMGERLKRSKESFSELNSVWYAHKLRNQIAHEPGFQLDYHQARRALNTFRRALKDLGAI